MRPLGVCRQPGPLCWPSSSFVLQVAPHCRYRRWLCKGDQIRELFCNQASSLECLLRHACRVEKTDDGCSSRGNSPAEVLPRAIFQTLPTRSQTHHTSQLHILVVHTVRCKNEAQDTTQMAWMRPRLIQGVVASGLLSTQS